MKVDVVIAFYEEDHAQYWKMVAWGLEQNKEFIDKVFIVNDGIWYNRVKSDRYSGEIIFLAHEWDGFGLAKSINQGIAQSRSEWVLVIEGDEILAPGSLEKTLKDAAAETLVCGRKRYLDSTTTLWHLEKDDVDFIDEDHRERFNRAAIQNGDRQWRLASGGHLLIHRPTHVKIGGFNEAYGYGYHDFDYAARWMKECGMGRVVWGTHLGEVWHIGSGKGRDLPSVEAARMFTETLVGLYGPRYHLGCGEKFFPEMINMDSSVDSVADVWHDCADLSWMPEGEAFWIEHGHFVEHMPLQQAMNHFRGAFRALKPGGTLAIECPDLLKVCREYLNGNKGPALEGLYSDQGKVLRPGWQHFYGWDVDTLRAALEEVGFEVEFAGSSPSAQCGWRDLRIEAVKPDGEEVGMESQAVSTDRFFKDGERGTHERAAQA